MKRIFLCALPLIGALIVASQAQAESVGFTFSGGGITGSGTFTVGPDIYAGPAYGTGTTPNTMGPGYFGLADPVNAGKITGASGTFSDTVLGISNVAITGLVANDYLPHFDNDPTIPYSFSWWTGVGFPTSAVSHLLSYDNLIYSGALAPETCEGVPAGGYLDDYGVMLTLANGDVVDVYSDGGGGIGSMIYGAAVANTSKILHYDDNCISSEVCTGALTFATDPVTFGAPEPSTWAMMLLGFAGLGFAGVRKARKTAAVA